MKISFDITSDESDIIALQYAYDSNINGDKEEFVIEQFKKFGRDCIISHLLQQAVPSEKDTKEAAIDFAKASISF